MNLDLQNLKMTDEEVRRLEWCHANLDEEQIVEVEEEALEITSREINAPIAAERLVELLVTVLVRNAEEQDGGKGWSQRYCADSFGMAYHTFSRCETSSSLPLRVTVWELITRGTFRDGRNPPLSQVAQRCDARRIIVRTAAHTARE